MENKSSESLASTFDGGLTEDEAAGRLKEYGPNEVPEKKTSLTMRLAKKFWGLTQWMLEFTVALEWILGKIHRSLRDNHPVILQRSR